MVRFTCMLLLLGAATCETNGPGPDNTVTTPTTGGTATINGTLECEDPIPTPEPGQNGNEECVVEQVFCGDVIQGSNDAGSLTYDRDYWVEAQELGALATEADDILDGPERVYAIVGQPTDSEITVTVTSCVQLWASYRRHGDTSDDWCDPTVAQSISGHFTGPWRDKTYTLINRSAGEYDWEIIIDSWDGQVGNYTLSVECTGG